MSQRYTSFLLRHWRFADGARRIMVEHVQTGARVTVASLDEATAWVGAQAAGGCVPPPGGAEEGDAPGAGAEFGGGQGEP